MVNFPVDHTRNGPSIFMKMKSVFKKNDEKILTINLKKTKNK